jgi:hypothetical protein
MPIDSARNAVFEKDGTEAVLLADRNSGKNEI